MVLCMARNVKWWRLCCADLVMLPEGLLHVDVRADSTLRSKVLAPQSQRSME